MLYTKETQPRASPVSFDLFGYPLEPPALQKPSAATAPASIRPTKPAEVSAPLLSRPRASLRENPVDEEDADSPGPDLDVDADDSPDTYVAKRMWKLLVSDLSGEVADEPDVERDLLGQMCSAKGLKRLYRKYDALVWMFDLNPDGAAMPFEWVCIEIGLDHEAVRRITARHMRQDLKRLLGVLSGMVGYNHAVRCQESLQEYVTLTGWNTS